MCVYNVLCVYIMCCVCFKTMENILLLFSDVFQNECILARNKCCNMELDRIIISSRLFNQNLTVSHPSKICSAFSAGKMSQVVFVTA